VLKAPDKGIVARQLAVHQACKALAAAAFGFGIRPPGVQACARSLAIGELHETLVDLCRYQETNSKAGSVHAAACAIPAGKTETFNFLGFTHICGRRRSGAFQLKRKTSSDRMRASLKDIKEGLRR
jgi:hypothetical protein